MPCGYFECSIENQNNWNVENKQLLYKSNIFIFQMATNYKLEVVPSSPISVLGEGPHWDADSQSLYYIDIYGNEASVLRYDYKENKTYTATIGML